MTRLPDAYVAGLIDGEGCVHVDARSLTAVVTVGMTARALDVLTALHRQFGGSLCRSRAATGKWEEAHAWSASGPRAAGLLRQVLPHLIIKAEQARLAIRLEDIKASLPRRANGMGVQWTNHGRDHCATIRERIMELNAKGPRQPEPATPPGYRRVARLVAGRWVTDQADLFSDLGWASFRGPWPKSGMIRSGVLFERLTPEHPTAGSGFSSSPGLLPTPDATESRRETRTGPLLRGVVQDLLPTPNTMDSLPPRDPEVVAARNRGNGDHGGSPRNLRESVVNELLPTPDTGTTPNGHGRRGGKRGNGHQSGQDLEAATLELLGTPKSRDYKGREFSTYKSLLNDLQEFAAVESGMLLPTPQAHDSGSSPEAHLARKPGRKQVTSLAIVAEHDLLGTGALLSTPQARDYKGLPSDDYNQACLVRDVSLLSTPQARDYLGAAGDGFCQKNLNRDVADIPSGLVAWGKYEPAIRRWEHLTGRDAPPPTEPGRNGPRLAAPFVEWMMGLPDGWVTDVPGMTRTEKLKTLGNGVVPAQAILALTRLMRRMPGDAR